MRNIGWPNHCVHAGPIIRAEYEYKECSLYERQQIIRRLMTFTRKLDIRFNAIYVEKKKGSDEIEITGNLSRQLADLVRQNMNMFSEYDVVKVYYDNGQTEVTKILVSVFTTLLSNVKFIKVIPSDYRLFQVADLICTLKLTELKSERHMLSKSEQYFFQDDRTFKKNYIKPLTKKQL